MTPDGDSPPRLAELRAALSGPAAAPPPPLRVLPAMALARGRAHEATGPARRALAAMAAGAAQAEGPVLWLVPAWRREMLNPYGLLPFADPGALILAACPQGADVLWAAEEALRAGSVALVVAEFARPPDLRQIRRLHLAAAEGVARAATTGRRAAPLGLLLAAENPESALTGIESRWALAPLPPDPDRPARLGRGVPVPAWRLERLRLRDAPPAAWRLDWEPEGPRLAEATDGAPHP